MIQAIDNLKEKVKEFINDHGQLNLPWLDGFLNILQSKTMIKSNTDDIHWFCQNGMSKSDEVLDFGCGGGYITYLISKWARKTTGVEYNGDWVGKVFDKNDYFSSFSFVQNIVQNLVGKNYLKFLFYEKLPLSFEDNYFDSIVLYAVIEHLDPVVEDNVFRELYRLLKPEGFLYIAKLPRLFSYQEYIARKFKLGSHSNLFTKGKITRLLNKHGFEIIKIEKSGLFFNHPNKITNFLFPLTSRLETVLKYTPLSYFAHDYRLIARKRIS